jgi:hypothetical protein
VRYDDVALYFATVPHSIGNYDRLLAGDYRLTTID